VLKEWKRPLKLPENGATRKKECPKIRRKSLFAITIFTGVPLPSSPFLLIPNSKGNFGPYATGFIHVPYNDLEALEAVLETNPNVVGFLVEPIQGEAGVFTPAADFIKGAKALSKEYNVLLITDEIQTGIGRTGSLLAVCGNCSCERACEQQVDTYIRPDMLILGKAISGGTYPVSAVLCDAEVMDVIQPGQHGSTFGGNPLAVTIAKKALEVVLNEKLAQNARRFGSHF
jgi:ornithine--oxo-acid transaminase